MQLTCLNNSSWLHVGRCIPNPGDYDAIKQYIPDEDQEWFGYGKVNYLKRRTISFGHSYTYSGQTKEGYAFPDPILPYLNMANQYADEVQWPRFNQCLVNWYPDGSAYISAHSDDEGELYLDEHGQTVVYGVSLTQGDGKDRKFRFRRKGTKGIHLDLSSGHGDIIVMAGLTQRYFTHEIPKQATNKGRISLTFRTFRTDEQ